MFTTINFSDDTSIAKSPSISNLSPLATNTNSSSEHLQLADCREELRQSKLANQRVREAKFELHQQCRNLLYDVYRSQQVSADPEADLHQINVHYVATHQALQHSERSRTLLGRRVGEQLEDDRLSEDERKVDITALVVNQEELTCQVVNLKHLLAEMKEALKTEISTNTVTEESWYWRAI